MYELEQLEEELVGVYDKLEQLQDDLETGMIGEAAGGYNITAREHERLVTEINRLIPIAAELERQIEAEKSAIREANDAENEHCSL